MSARRRMTYERLAAARILAALGWSYAEIARRIGVSKGCVEYHAATIYRQEPAR